MPFNTAHFRLDRESIRADFKNDVIAAGGEFIGTITFLLLGLGGIQAAATSNSASLAAATSEQGGASSINEVASIEQLTYISASMGLSLLFSAWIFYRATGAAFNPNVSFALLLIGVIKPVRFVLYCIAQIVGAIVASAILEGLLPGPLAVTPGLGAGTNRAQGVWIEAFATCALILSVLFLAVEKHRATFMAPIGIGLTLFAAHLWAVVYTGCAVNTARAFGPAVVTGFNNEQWIYWLGPTIGAFLSVGIYTTLKWCKYWRLNVGQDTDNPTKSPSLFLESTHSRRSDSLGGGGRRNHSHSAPAGIEQTLATGGEKRGHHDGVGGGAGAGTGPRTEGDNMV